MFYKLTKQDYRDKILPLMQKNLLTPKLQVFKYFLTKPSNVNFKLRPIPTYPVSYLVLAAVISHLDD